jgi:hypothetical protein
MVHDKNRGIHPKFGIPEIMSVISFAGRKAHRSYSYRTIVTGYGIELIEGMAYIQLALRIAFYDDIALPKFLPCRTVLSEQMIDA